MRRSHTLHGSCWLPNATPGCTLPVNNASPQPPSPPLPSSIDGHSDDEDDIAPPPLTLTPTPTPTLAAAASPTPGCARASGCPVELPRPVPASARLPTAAAALPDMSVSSPPFNSAVRTTRSQGTTAVCSHVCALSRVPTVKSVPHKCRRCRSICHNHTHGCMQIHEPQPETWRGHDKTVTQEHRQSQRGHQRPYAPWTTFPQ